MTTVRSNSIRSVSGSSSCCSFGIVMVIGCVAVGEGGSCLTIVTVGDADSSLRSNWGGVVSESSSAAGDCVSWTSEVSLGLGILSGEVLKEARCRGDKELRMACGGGEGLSCARIMRLAIAEEGSEK